MPSSSRAPTPTSTAKLCSTCPSCQGPLSGAPAVRCRGADRQVWNYRRCERCGLLWLTPLPGPEQSALSHAETYPQQGQTKFPHWLEQIRHRAQQRRAHLVDRTLCSPGGRILDVGCGDGSFLARMARLGYAITGTEIAAPALALAAAVPGIELWRGPLRPDAFPAGHFDAVTIWHVLEHVTEPGELLALCRRFLKPGGHLFLEVPNLGSWQARLFGRHWLHLDPPRHVAQFTPAALQELVQRAGFEVLKRGTVDFQMGTFGFVQSALNVVVEPRDAFYWLLLSRGRMPAPLLSKLLSFLLAPVVAPVAGAWTLLEAAAGAGAVLRLVCRLSTTGGASPK